MSGTFDDNHPGAGYGYSHARGNNLWPLFADDLFRLAHDGHRLRVDQDLIAAGLACALLAELAVTNHLAVDGDKLVVTSRRPPPDALAHTLLTEVMSQPDPVPVPDWLRYLSARPSYASGHFHAYEQVARRLIRSGDLVEVPRRRLFGPPRSGYAPTDNNKAYWTCARLNMVAERGYHFDAFDQVLAGLCLSTGVYRRVFSSPAQVIQRLGHDSRRIRPPIPTLLRHLDRLVGNTVAINS
ncbi:GPP34 family phosphoprotein [Actinoplanes sp. NPDC020271]|uniref:GOLPH3/VPS74 family protein n=1 Tax=Actinoplanes sp. NPDC020271 TaxID=3363896 RepID=UPI0037AA147B